MDKLELIDQNEDLMTTIDILQMEITEARLDGNDIKVAKTLQKMENLLFDVQVLLTSNNEFLSEEQS